MVGKKGKSGPPGHTRNRGVKRGGKKGRSGPPGNTKQLQHGVVRYGEEGKLPVGCEWIEVARDALQAKLVEAVTSSHGKVSIPHEMAIDRAGYWQAARLMFERWVRLQSGDDDIPATITTTSVEKKGEGGATVTRTRKSGMDLEERGRFAERIGKAIESRDRAIERLALDAEDSEDVFAFLDVAPNEPVQDCQSQEGDTEPKNVHEVAPEGDERPAANPQNEEEA